MAANDFKMRTPLIPEFTIERDVPSGGTATINVGEPTKSVDAAAASPYLGTVAICVDADGSTAQRFTGFAKSTSTDTASVAGVVNTILPLPGLIYSGKAKTASTANTSALIRALRGKRVLFDLTGTAWTVDAAAADAVANCLVIVDGSSTTQELFFVYAPHGTFLDFAISA